MLLESAGITLPYLYRIDMYAVVVGSIALTRMLW